MKIEQEKIIVDEKLLHLEYNKHKLSNLLQKKRKKHKKNLTHVFQKKNTKKHKEINIIAFQEFSGIRSRR